LAHAPFDLVPAGDHVAYMHDITILDRQSPARLEYALAQVEQAIANPPCTTLVMSLEDFTVGDGLLDASVDGRGPQRLR
jgi:hypothetical protein